MLQSSLMIVHAVRAGRRIQMQRPRSAPAAKPGKAGSDGEDSPTSVLDAAAEPDQAAAPPPPVAKQARWQLVGNLGKGDATALLCSSAHSLRQGLVGGAL